MPLPTGARIGPYEVTGALGAGGMGEVYRAHDTNLKRTVAIKVLPEGFAGDAERLARFQREAEVLAALNHPNIAAIYGLERSGSTTALVMELVDGPTLADHIAAGPLPLAETVAIARQIAEALEAAHDNGIIHRDLKPANVKVRTDDTVKVLDFGLAKIAKSGSGDEDRHSAATMTSPAMTQMGMILGTAAYMAPEQAKGRLVDRRADIWAFGCVLYEMFTGQRAFQGSDVTDTLATLLKTDPDWTRLPADVPASIRRLLRRCLEKDPRKRLSAIGDARLELNERDDEPRDSQPRQKSHTIAWIGAIIAAVAVTLAAAPYFTSERPTDPRRTLALTAPAGARQVLISPDGRWLAASTTAGTLHVRRIEEADWRELRGVSVDFGIFWSADSRQIGFSSGTALKRVDLVGSRALTICEGCIAPNSLRGGAWNAAGDILFAGGTADVLGGLSRIHETGGAVTSATAADRARGENSHRYPAFLPDGRQFLYTVRRDNGEHEIRRGSIDGGEMHVVASAFSEMAYSEGHILFVRDEMLVAQAIEPQTARVSGDPVTVAANVGYSATVGRALFSVAGDGTVVFAPASDSVGLRWFNRRGELQAALTADRAGGGGFRVSRDGTRVVAAIPDLEKSSTDIYVIDVASGARTRLTSHPAWDESPVWSPDNRRVAYRANHGRPGLYVQSIAGGDERRLLDQEGFDRLDPEDWSPGLTNLMVNRWAAATADDLMLVSVTEPVEMKPWLATKSSETDARFSPDGRFVAYASDASGSSEIYVSAFANPGRPNRITSAGGHQPVWSHSGRELFYIDANQWLVEVAIRTEPSIETGPPSRLFRLERGDFGSVTFDVDRDGRFLIPVVDRLRTNTGLPLFYVLTNWSGPFRQAR